MFDLTNTIVRNSLQIVLWGLENSGKTWFLEAFKKAVAIRNISDMDFYYQLRDFDGNILPAYGLHQKNNIKHIDNHHRWVFSRLPKIGSVAQQISAHTLYLNIHDLDGQNSLVLSGDAKKVYRNADLIIVFLDPTHQMQPNNTVQEPELEHEKNKSGPDLFEIFGDDIKYKKPEVVEENFSSIGYPDGIENLLTPIAENPKLPHIAVCISKADTVSEIIDDHRIFIKNHFGNKVYTSLSHLENNLKYFHITSIGYAINNPNISKSSDCANAIIDENQWRPEVEAPLYWFFEKIKQEELKSKGGWASKFFQEENLKKYISYPGTS